MADYSVARVIDSRVDWEAPRVLPARVGPNSSTWKSFTAPDPKSTSPVITAQVSSYNTAVGRVVLYHMEAELEVAGINARALFEGESRIALRAWPFHSACSSLSLSINDVSTAIPNPMAITSALTAQGISSHSMALTSSTCPTAPDVYADYDAAVGVAMPFGLPAGGPFSSYAVNSRTSGILGIKPGSYNEGNNDPNAGALTPDTFTLLVKFDEPLISSPFSFTQDALSKGLVGINSLQVSAQITAPHRMLSLALFTGEPSTPGNSGVTLQSVKITPTAQSLLLSFCTAEPRSQVERPLALSYDFVSIMSFTTQSGDDMEIGGKASFSSAVVELPVVPSYLLIRANYPLTALQDASKSLADVNFPLEEISMSFGSRSGLISGAKESQLYQMSIAAGANVPYYLWNGASMFQSADAKAAYDSGDDLQMAAGGVFIVDVAASLSLPPGVVPGQALRMSMSVENARFRNNTNAIVSKPIMQIIALTSGTLTNEAGSSLLQIGGIPGSDAAIFQEASEFEQSQFSAMARDGGYGGGSLMDWIRRLKPFMSKAVRAAPDFVGAINPNLRAPTEAVRDLAISLGAGASKKKGGGTIGGKMSGGGTLGGRRR